MNTKTAKEKFDNRLAELAKQQQPAHYANNNSHLVIYEKLLEIQEELHKLHENLNNSK